MPLYRELGGGDAMKGFEASYKLSYQELNKKLHDMGHAHPVTCVDCHDPKTMQLLVTRPGFIQGHPATGQLRRGDAVRAVDRALAAGGKAKAYDPNTDATRTEMRSFVCGQCHVEYYCSSQMPLTLPVGQGPARRPDRDVLERDQVPRRRAASSTTSTPRPARRS